MPLKQNRPKQRTRHKPQPLLTLRQRAEAAWEAHHQDAIKLSDVDVQRLVHDLQVHQIELEMQNEELRSAQIALAESHDRFSELYDYAPVGYITLDPDTTIREANVKAAVLLGLERPLLVGNRFTRFIAREFQDVFYLHQQAVLAGGDKQICELQLRRSDGSAFFAQLETACMGDFSTRTIQIRCVFTDISARKLAEANLQQSHDQLEQRVIERTSELAQTNELLTSEIAVHAQAGLELQRLAALLNMSSDAVIIRELDGTIRYWNQGAERLYGYSRAEAIGGNTHKLLGTVFPDGIEASQKQLIRVGMWAGEVAQRTKTGRKITVESHCQLVKQPDEPAIVLITNHDVTGRVALEEAIVTAAERARERLGQDLHDGLCQLLAAARLKADSLAARLELEAPGELKAAQTTTSLIKQAFDEARRMARGLDPVEPVPEGLVIALQDLAGTIKRLFNVACVCDIPGPVLISDPIVATELFRIAQEATNNAIKHSHAQAITIRLTQVSEELTLTVSCDGRAFPKNPPTRGMGLKAMRFRAKRIAARLKIGPGRKGGVNVCCVIRLPAGPNPSPNRRADSREHQMLLSAVRSEVETHQT